MPIHSISALQTSVATYHGTLDPARQKEMLTRMTLAALQLAGRLMALPSSGAAVPVATGLFTEGAEPRADRQPMLASAV